MNNLREKLSTTIKHKREKLSSSSVSSYVSTLFNLPKKLGASKDVDIDWYDDNIDEILEHVKDIPSNKRKSILSPLYVLTDNKKIHSLMMDDVKNVNEGYKQQKMSVNEKENWMEWDDIYSVYEKRSPRAYDLFKQKMLNDSEIEFLNQYVILACYTQFPPRRLLDYGLMKIRGCDQNVDNCMTAKKLTFNQYKTFKVYGQQIFESPVVLSNIFRKWSKVNPSSYLIWNKSGKSTTSQQLNGMLNEIFGKDVSVNIIRHSYLTNFYGGMMPSMIEMEDMAKKMGHSVKQAMLYIKRS